MTDDVKINFTDTYVHSTNINQIEKINSLMTIGARGKSAYELWLESGYSGSIEDFLFWLRSDSYEYTQMVASNSWTIVHDLGKYPSATIVDSAGTMVVGEVEYISVNEIRIHFNAAFSGKAYLN